MVPAVKDVEIVQPGKSTPDAARIVEVARDASVSLVESDELLEVLARVPQGSVPEDLLGVAAEIMAWLGSLDAQSAPEVESGGEPEMS